MKALIRKKKETITEDMGISGIDWETGMPLTNPVWAEGPYTLIENYTPPAEDTDESVTANTNTDAERNAEIADLEARLAALKGL